MHDGMAVTPLTVVPGPPGRFQYAPGTYSHQLRMSSRLTGPSRLPEHERAWNEQLRIGLRVVLAGRGPLGDRHVARRPHERPELGRRHGTLVHPEPVHLDSTDRTLLGVEALVAHVERAARNEDHVRGRRHAG